MFTIKYLFIYIYWMKVSNKIRLPTETFITENKFINNI